MQFSDIFMQHNATCYTTTKRTCPVEHHNRYSNAIYCAIHNCCNIVICRQPLDGILCILRSHGSRGAENGSTTIKKYRLADISANLFFFMRLTKVRNVWTQPLKPLIPTDYIVIAPLKVYVRLCEIA